MIITAYLTPSIALPRPPRQESASVTSIGVPIVSFAPQKEDEYATEQTNYIVVPSYSAWFDYNGIHAVEKRGLPEFFNTRNISKSPEM